MYKTANFLPRGVHTPSQSLRHFGLKILKCYGRLMALRNRVGPDGQITDATTRGMLTGNRGILHSAEKVMGPALWKHRAWICCTLDWQGRQRDVMTGRNWTELFFLDEADAMAAGHRPCAYCRRSSYNAFLMLGVVA